MTNANPIASGRSLFIVALGTITGIWFTLPAPANAADADTGKQTFQATCVPAHSSAAGIGALGGGQLGPDLTDVVTRYGGAAAVNGFLSGMPTPTMKAVWSQHPPTPEERGSVVSFLGQAGVTLRPAQAIWQLAA